MGTNGQTNVAAEYTDIMLIDGECALCHGITRFVIARDPAKRFRFVALQSPAGIGLLRRHGLPEGDMDTFVLIDGGRAYVKSEAALWVLRKLGGGWRMLAMLMVVPSFIRDWAYDRIAGSRYRLFGRSEVCLLPTPDIVSRFAPAEEGADGNDEEGKADLR
ncbi:thiol-disulfide oxidoreductase DCC family protein [Paenibacillus xanthanilyticus]|uniref:Thiol-disulfide oxidoreductase DCC family protein n=1 Tax=Paenibacillus xanthanilyticus TaxID=1783531 RepID=A0ABV8K5B8_9BACL